MPAGAGAIGTNKSGVEIMNEEDLQGLTVAELRKAMALWRVPFRSTMRKRELVDSCIQFLHSGHPNVHLFKREVEELKKTKPSSTLSAADILTTLKKFPPLPVTTTEAVPGDGFKKPPEPKAGAVCNSGSKETVTFSKNPLDQKDGKGQDDSDCEVMEVVIQPQESKVPTASINMWPMMFRDVIKELMEPVELARNTPCEDTLFRRSSLSSTIQTMSVSLNVSPQDRSLLFSSNGGRKYKVCVRFCVRPDGESRNPEPEDCFPSNLALLVNNKKVSIDSRMIKAMRKTYSKPLDITRLISENETENALTVAWEPEDPTVFVMSAYLCQPLTLSDISQKLMSVPRIDKEQCFQKIKKMIWKDDADIDCPDFAKISLICPFSSQVMRVPVRGILCSHVNCFDIYNFIITNYQAKSTTAFCPWCRTAIKIEDLRRDSFLELVIHFLGKSGQGTVQIHEITIHREDSCDDVLNKLKDNGGRQAGASSSSEDKIVIEID